jgi:hypothetical protein
MEMDLSADIADVRLVSSDVGEVMRVELGLEGEARGMISRGSWAPEKSG